MTIDSTIVGAVATAVSIVAENVGVGVLRAAGKDVWDKVKSLLHIDNTESLSQKEIESFVLERLTASPQLLLPVLEALKDSESSAVKQLVGNIDAQKVIVIQNNSGPITMI